MGAYVNGVYVPTLAETGWDDEINDLLTSVGRKAIDPTLAPYGADPTGATDSTAAFDAAAIDAGKGGTIAVPPGVFELTDWTPPYQVNVVGAGCPSPHATTTGTTLKAGAGADWVVKLLAVTENLYNPSIRHLRIHGDNTAGGLTLNSGADAHGIQSPFFEDVEFYRCTTGTKLDTSIVTQVDKAVFVSCRWVEMGTEGLWLNSTNADLVSVHGGYVTGADVALRLTAGSASFYDFTIGSCDTSILFDSPGMGALTLVDFVDEDVDISIDGSAYWPSQGVTAIGCVFQADTTTIDIGVSGTFYALNSVFNNGPLVGGTNAMFVDTNCRFNTPAIWTPTAAANAGRLSTNSQDDTAREGRIRFYGGANGDIVKFHADVSGNVSASLLLQGETLIQAGSATNDGKIYWGNDPNGVYLLNAGGSLLTNSQVTFARTSETDQAIATLKAGESVAWWGALANGKMTWGPGGGVGGDTELSRSAANTLATGANDTFKTGAAIHGSLPAASGYAAGAQFYCTTDKQPLWSDGTNWVEADGTNH